MANHWIYLSILIHFFIQTTTSTDYDVLILGAGYAGVGAGKYFHDNGVDKFLILEANDYIGGRVKNINFGGASIPMGAGWIHYADNENSIYNLAQKYNMNMVSDTYEYGDIFFRDGETGTRYPKSKVVARVNDVIKYAEEMDKNLEKRLKEGRYDLDVATGMRWAGWRANSTLDEAIEYFMFDFENGIEPNALSATSYGYTGSGNDKLVTDSKGYSYPVIQESKPFENKIKLNKEVTHIRQENDGTITVTVKDGDTTETYTSKQVIVTFSSGVLNADIVTFEPALPAWKKEALAMAPMCHYCKLFMQFENKFWDDTKYLMIATKFRGQFMHWQDLSTLFNVNNMLIATVTGEICKESFKYSDDEMMEMAYNTLKKVYEKAEKPKVMIRNRWSEDKRFLGSYSYQAPGINSDDWDALEHPVKQSLWFAGEYLGRIDFGYAHGAYDIGHNIAAKVKDCLNDKKKCPEAKPERKLKKECKSVSDVMLASIYVNMVTILMHAIL